MPRSGWVAGGTVLAALSFLAGQPLGADPATIAAVILAAVGAIVAATTLAIAAGRAHPGAPMMGLLLGLGLVAIRTLTFGAADPPRTAIASSATGAGSWTGRVVTVGSPRDGRQVATLVIGEVGRALTVAATLPRYPEIRPGLRVSVGGRLEANPDSDYGRHLASIGVDATLRADVLTIVGGVDDPGAVLESIRRAGDRALATALAEPEAGLASGILIGLRDRVDRDLAAAFVAAGVSHVVAISGWNIAIVAALVAAALRRWPRRRRAIATLATIALYTVLTGASPSVLRAAVMAAVAIGMRESGRPGRAATALGWAVAGIVVVGPDLVTDAGFALSAAATGGLIAWATPLTERLRRGRGGRLPGWLTESLGVSFAAELATLPIALLWFGRIPVIAPLVNLGVVPLVAPAMASGAVALAGGGIVAVGGPTILATIAGLPAWTALALIVAIVRIAAALPFASVTLEPPLSLVAAAIATAAVAGVALRIRRRDADDWMTAVERAEPAVAVTGRRHPRRTIPSTAARLVSVGLVVAIASLGALVVTRPDGRVRITALDVGQGDAILVEADRGSRLLVDGGPDPDRLLIALDTHLPPWDRRIDLVILSHPHEDHVAGLAMLLARYRVGRVVEPGMHGPGPGYRAWAAQLSAEGRRAGQLTTGDRFTLDSIGFRVLWPDRNAVPREPPNSGTAINNVSIVLLGTFGSERFLLAGDIEDGIDPILLARGVPSVEVLKVAHHGSRTSSTGAFLDAVRPRIAVISVGADNPYGHPSPATVARLTDRRATVYRTDEDGSVTIQLDGRRAIATTVRSATAAATAAIGSRRSGPVIAPGTTRQTIPFGPPVLVAYGCAVPSRSVAYHRANDRSSGRGP